MGQRRRFSAAQIVNLLREAGVLLSQGRTVLQACKQLAVSDKSNDRWRREYGGMKVDQAKRLKDLEKENARLKRVGVKTLFIAPASPWRDSYVESFNGKLRDELLNGEIFYSLNEAKVLIERWRVAYNTIRLHSALEYKPPAPEALMPQVACLRYATAANLEYTERNGGTKHGGRS